MSDADFERRVAAALRAHVPTDPSARRAIMARVRASSTRPRRADPLAWRGTRSSLVGLALAAGIGSIATLLPGTRVAREAGPVAVVIGDTVVASLHDTLRLVRLLQDGAHRYAFAVDGTRRIPDPAAPRARGSDGRVYALLHVVPASD